MYIRFVTGQFDRDSGLESGFFQTALDICYDDWSVQEWVKVEIRRSLDWFNDNLEKPKRVYSTSGRRRGQPGVCWFRPEAKRHLEEAHHMAWLLSEADVPVRRVGAWHPGQVVWRDKHQIVAIKNRSGPVFV